MSSSDPFCESSFWTSTGHHVHPIKNPLSMATGIIMFLVPILVNNVYCPYNSQDTPIFLLIAKASLALTGAGTVYFHTIYPDQAANEHFINYQLCDWAPIVIMCTHILILYVQALIRNKISERWLSLLIFIIYAWCLLLILGMDTMTENYWRQKLDTPNNPSVYGTILNAVLLIPLACILLYTTIFKFKWKDASYLWYSMFIAATLWILNAYTCHDYPWTSVFHAIYHLIISYSFIYAACLGITLELDIEIESWTFYRINYVWPMVSKNKFIIYI
jgi:hypothetical protein